MSYAGKEVVHGQNHHYPVAHATFCPSPPCSKTSLPKVDTAVYAQYPTLSPCAGCFPGVTPSFVSAGGPSQHESLAQGSVTPRVILICNFLSLPVETGGLLAGRAKGSLSLLFSGRDSGCWEDEGVHHMSTLGWVWFYKCTFRLFGEQ